MRMVMKQSKPRKYHLILSCVALFYLFFVIIGQYQLSANNNNNIKDENVLQHFMSKNAIIVGIVKDAANTLHSLLSDLDDLSTYFNLTQFIIFESNSEDNTLQILLNWKESASSNKANITILNGDETLSNHFNIDWFELSKSFKFKEQRYDFYRNMMLD